MNYYYWTGSSTDDAWATHWLRESAACGNYAKIAFPLMFQTEIPKKGDYDMKGLYEVFAVYGADRDHPMIVLPDAGRYVIAVDEEDAKLKSGIYQKFDSKWDADYLTIIVRKLGDVKIKEKPKEVKNV